MAKSAAELSLKFTRLATTFPRANREAVENAALAAKEDFEAAYSSAGIRPRQTKIAGREWRGVRYDVKGATNATAIIRATRPIHLVDNPTKPHFIAAKGLGGSRRSRTGRAKAIRTGGALSALGTFGGGPSGFGGLRGGGKGAKALKVPFGYRAYVFHPGTAGKGVFKRTKPKVARAMPRVFAASHRTSLAKTFTRAA